MELVEDAIEPALTEDEVAQLLRVSRTVLSRMRRRGEGPDYVTCSGFVRYSRKAVRRFLDNPNSPQDINETG
jgi:hypothetical protein